MFGQCPRNFSTIDSAPFPFFVKTVYIFRDEQYRQMWSELEMLVKAYADTSPNHQKVLECLLDCKKPTAEEKSPKKTDKVFVKDEKMDMDSQIEQSWKTLEK